MAAAPEPDSSPHRPRFGPGGGARLSHTSPLDDIAVPARDPGLSPALGVPKARALETVKESWRIGFCCARSGHSLGQMRSPGLRRAWALCARAIPRCSVYSRTMS